MQRPSALDIQDESEETETLGDDWNVQEACRVRLICSFCHVTIHAH